MNEEKIIDGVDVSKCKFYREDGACALSEIKEYDKKSGIMIFKPYFCKHADCRKCDFKQLKRYENEYEGFAVKYTDMELALKRKEEELEQYKKSKQASYESMQAEWNNAVLENRKLKKECEEWKNKYYASTTEVKADLIKQLDELKEAFNNTIELSKIYKKQIFKSSEKALKYSQALQEIKEIAKKEVETRMLFADKESFCDFNKILQKCEVIDANIQS